MTKIHGHVQEILHTDVLREVVLSGGCISDVRRLTLGDGREIVAKVGAGAAPGLTLEGSMLRFLNANTALPVPNILFADDHLLLMSFIPGGGSISVTTEEDAAHHLATLHNITAASFGFSYDTLIGGLPQPNPPESSWLTFFRDHRLMHMGEHAHAAGQLPAQILSRLEKLCAQLDRWLTEPASPSLLHGDLWSGNILVYAGRISGFVDPAIYYGDSEIELAFTTLFGTFGESFFRKYAELRGLGPGFFEERRDIYNLYPLLVHIRLFGGHYVDSLERTIKRFGF